MTFPVSLKSGCFPLICLAGLACGGLGGCYVPNGGWTLRSGVDWRTPRKPAAFLEMVDTRWDEWNRVAQMNAMQSACESPWQRQGNPGPAGFLPATATPADPAAISPDTSAPTSSGPTEPAPLPPVPETAARKARPSVVPAGAWIFQK